MGVAPCESPELEWLEYVRGCYLCTDARGTGQVDGLLLDRIGPPPDHKSAWELSWYQPTHPDLADMMGRWGVHVSNLRRFASAPGVFYRANPPGLYMDESITGELRYAQKLAPGILYYGTDPDPRVPRMVKSARS